MATSEFSHYRRADGWLGQRFLYLERTTSTNEVLRRLAEEGAAEGMVILADEEMTTCVSISGACCKISSKRMP